MGNNNRSSLREFLLSLPQRQLIEKRVIANAVDTLSRIISLDIVDTDHERFGRIYLKDGKPTLEVSILLVKNLMLIDLTFDKDQQVTSTFFLSRSTGINLKTFSSAEASNEDLDAFDKENISYRTELDIDVSGAGIQFSYSAEGDRKTVNALITYGYKCISALQSLSEKGA